MKIMDNMLYWTDHPDMVKQVRTHIHDYFTSDSEYTHIPLEHKHVIFSLACLNRVPNKFNIDRPPEVELRIAYFKLLPVFEVIVGDERVLIVIRMKR